MCLRAQLGWLPAPRRRSTATVGPSSRPMLAGWGSVSCTRSASSALGEAAGPVSEPDLAQRPEQSAEDPAPVATPCADETLTVLDVLAEESVAPEEGIAGPVGGQEPSTSAQGTQTSPTTTTPTSPASEAAADTTADATTAEESPEQTTPADSPTPDTPSAHRRSQPPTSG